MLNDLYNVSVDPEHWLCSHECYWYAYRNSIIFTTVPASELPNSKSINYAFFDRTNPPPYRSSYVTHRPPWFSFKTHTRSKSSGEAQSSKAVDGSVQGFNPESKTMGWAEQWCNLERPPARWDASSLKMVMGTLKKTLSKEGTSAGVAGQDEGQILEWLGAGAPVDRDSQPELPPIRVSISKWYGGDLTSGRQDVSAEEVAKSSAKVAFLCKWGRGGETVRDDASASDIDPVAEG